MVPSNYISDISGLNALVETFSMKKIKFLSKLLKCDVKLLWLLSRRPVTSKFVSVLAKQNKYFCHHFSPSNLLPHRANCIFGLKSKFGVYFSNESGIFLLSFSFPFFFSPQLKIIICINIVYLLQTNIIPPSPDAHIAKAAAHNGKITDSCLENFQRSFDSQKISGQRKFISMIKSCLSKESAQVFEWQD